MLGSVPKGSFLGTSVSSSCLISCPHSALDGGAICSPSISCSVWDAAGLVFTSSTVPSHCSAALSSLLAESLFQKGQWVYHWETGGSTAARALPARELTHMLGDQPPGLSREVSTVPDQETRGGSHRVLWTCSAQASQALYLGN